MLYNSLLFSKIECSIGVDKWVKVLDIQEKPSMKILYKFICSYLEENKLKIFRWKIMQYIIPTNKLLFQWKIVNNNRCNFCGNEEDYLHYFITCSFFKTFREKIYNLFKSNNLEFTLLKLKHLILGYKISDNNYYGVNYFITILGFPIYKSYYLSEQNVNVYKFFIYELNKRIDDIKNHSTNNSFCML
jgi:hypothetical protein